MSIEAKGELSNCFNQFSKSGEFLVSCFVSLILFPECAPSQSIEM